MAHLMCKGCRRQAGMFLREARDLRAKEQKWFYYVGRPGVLKHRSEQLRKAARLTMRFCTSTNKTHSTR